MKHALMLTLSALTLASCTTRTPATPAAPTGQVAYGLSGNTLLTFGLGNASDSLTRRTVTGLAAGETLVDLDVRNTDGQLYGVTSGGAVYRLDPATAQASRDSAISATSVVAVDFNPAANRLRVLSAADVNARHTLSAAPIPAVTGTTPDSTFTFGAGDVNAGRNPNLVAAAYTNSFNDTGKVNSGLTTALYSIDADADALIAHPAAGAPQFSTLSTVGSLGMDVTAGGTGFDISGANTAVLSRSGNGSTSLYTVDLTTGRATLLTTLSGAALSSIALKLAQP